MPIIGQISVGDGATFTPSVSSAGELSWTNNKNLPNPESVDIAQAVVDAGSLDSRYLQLSGGTMTGTINLANGGGYITGFSSGAYIYGNPTNTNNDSMLVLYTNANASGFLLQGGDGTNRKRLIGKADGTLTWDSKNVLTDKVQTVSNLSTIITFNSGYTLRGGTLHLIAGFLVMMKIGVNFANAVSANTKVTIGTISSEYRPPNDAFGGGEDSLAFIGSDGSVSMRPSVNKNTNSWSWVTILYTLI